MSVAVIFFYGILIQGWAAPEVPSFVGANGVTAAQINVAWYAPNTLGYCKIYRNGVSVCTVPVIPNNLIYKEPNLFQDTGLNPSTTYSHFVTAVDSSDVESPSSLTVSATTRPASQNGLIPAERSVNWGPGLMAPSGLIMMRVGR
jgi:hypothetical protein